jgi:2-iminobutanoate/2-iminopropanoate deaminase
MDCIKNREKNEMINIIQTNKAPAAIGPYSQAAGFGDFIFTSGQIPLSPETGEIVGNDISSQTEQVMKNISALLEAAGSSFSNVVKTTCFITDMAHFSAFNEEYSSYFTGNRPARSCVAVKQLPRDVLVEIETIAIKG